jgi:hypothetical protein
LREDQEDYERILAGFPHLEWLGVPRSWDRVREGFHPFSPERVVIFSGDRPSWEAEHLKEVKERVRGRVERHRLRNKSGLGMPQEKFDLLVGIIDRMAGYYQVPDLLEEWACGLVWREEFSSTSIGNGVGLVHQFQKPMTSDVVRTACAFADWWAFLIREGIDSESLDGKPTYALIGHVWDRYRPGFERQYLWATQLLMRRDTFDRSTDQDKEVSWKGVAAMDRVSAARFLNRQLAFGLKDELEKEQARVH